MKTSKEGQAVKPAGKVKAKPRTIKKSLVKDTDADGSSSYVDLGKADFSSRPHGRTTESFGPDHEPGTVK